jgi:hypothetical protein
VRRPALSVTGLVLALVLPLAACGAADAGGPRAELLQFEQFRELQVD